jgi:PEP-CTERM motif
LKNQQATLLIAVILAAPVFAVADNIPAHFKGGSKYVALSEGFADQQDLQGGSARCNFLFSSIKENGSKTSSVAGGSLNEFAKGEMGSNLGALPRTGMGSDSSPVKVVDFGSNQGTSSASAKNNGKGDGKHNGNDGNRNGTGVGSETPSPVISVPEPESQTLLLVGLAGLGVFVFRRRTLTNAI